MTLDKIIKGMGNIAGSSVNKISKFAAISALAFMPYVSNCDDDEFGIPLPPGEERKEKVKVDSNKSKEEQIKDLEDRLKKLKEEVNYESKENFVDKKIIYDSNLSSEHIEEQKRVDKLRNKKSYHLFANLLLEYLTENLKKKPSIEKIYEKKIIDYFFLSNTIQDNLKIIEIVSSNLKEHPEDSFENYKLLNRSLKQLIRYDDFKGDFLRQLANVRYDLGNEYQENYNFEKSYEFFFSAKKIFKSIGDIRKSKFSEYRYKESLGLYNKLNKIKNMGDGTSKFLSYVMFGLFDEVKKIKVYEEDKYVSLLSLMFEKKTTEDENILLIKKLKSFFYHVKEPVVKKKLYDKIIFFNSFLLSSKNLKVKYDAEILKRTFPKPKQYNYFSLSSIDEDHFYRRNSSDIIEKLERDVFLNLTFDKDSIFIDKKNRMNVFRSYNLSRNFGYIKSKYLLEDGVIGESLSFDGKRSMVINTDCANLNKGFTISYIVKVLNSDTGVLFDSRFIRISYAFRKMYVGMKLGSGYDSKSKSFQNGKWVSVILTHPYKKACKLYINGKDVGNFDFEKNISNSFFGDSSLGSSLNKDFYFKGNVDEFRIYTRNLTYKEISSYFETINKKHKEKFGRFLDN